MRGSQAVAITRNDGYYVQVVGALMVFASSSKIVTGADGLCRPVVLVMDFVMQGCSFSNIQLRSAKNNANLGLPPVPPCRMRSPPHLASSQSVPWPTSRLLRSSYSPTAQVRSSGHYMFQIRTRIRPAPSEPSKPPLPRDSHQLLSTRLPLLSLQASG